MERSLTKLNYGVETCKGYRRITALKEPLKEPLSEPFEGYRILTFPVLLNPSVGSLDAFYGFGPAAPGAKSRGLRGSKGSKAGMKVGAFWGFGFRV